MRRQKTSVELHPFDNLNIGLAAAALFNRDHPIFTDFEKCFGEDLTDRRVVIARDCGDLLDFFPILVVNLLRLLTNLGRNCLTGRCDSARECHRICTRRNHLQTLAINRFGENGRGRGSITCDVVGLACRLFDELAGEILVRVIQFDIFGDSHTVFRDLWRTPALIQNGVATARSQGAANGSCQL